MDEFINIKWEYKSLDNYEVDKKTFVDEVSNSYAYRNIVGNNILVEEVIKITPIKEYVPGSTYFTMDLPNSSLHKDEQDKCLQALILYQSGRTNLLLQEQNLINTYLRLKPKIVTENTKFLDHVKSKWTTDKNFKIKPALTNFALEYWKRKLKLIKKYSQCYRQYDTLPFSIDENSEAIEMLQVKTLLELGTVAKFLQPTLAMKTTLAVNTLPQVDDASLNSKQPVSMDGNIQNLLQQNPDIDVIMSSGSLTRFINFMDDQPWDLPVLIRNQSNLNGEMKNKSVIYMDKPLARKNINLSHINENVHKVLFKSNFCTAEEFSFPIAEPRIQLDEKEENLNVNEVEEITVNKSLKFKGKINHNVSYNIWKLHMKVDENDLSKFKCKYKHFNVLVRCKVDACERSEKGAFTPICTHTKLENQLKYGANVCTVSELAKQWVLLSARPFSKLYRARIHNKTSEVIAIENCTLQKINAEALYHHKYKPHQGLILLYKFLNEMSKYEPANYLIRYSPKIGPFLVVLKESKKDIVGVYDLHEDYQQNSGFLKEINENWCPIDVNYILPIHRQTRRLPGTFKPTFKRKVPFKK